MIVIVDFGSGNLGSIASMLRKLGIPSVTSGDPEVVAAADRLILPGVGAFDHAMGRLVSGGYVPILRRKVLEEGAPLLGVCLGMQLLSRGSEEGDAPGLGWIDARTVRFRPESAAGPVRVPHMGWADVRAARPHPLLEGLEEDARFYFAHSFHVVPERDDDVLAWAEHGDRFVSAVARDHVMGVQFHPEKSHRFGLRLLENFATRSFGGAPAAGGAG